MSWIDIRRNIGDEISILFAVMAEAALPELLLDEKEDSVESTPLQSDYKSESQPRQH